MQATYPTALVQPMKEELTEQGFQELLTAASVDKLLAQSGSILVVINSVCGCSAGALRPGVLSALQQTEKPPAHITTSFAGYDLEAVAKVREYLMPYPPSSPCVALFKDKKLLFFLERHQIEGSTAGQIAQVLEQAFQAHC